MTDVILKNAHIITMDTALPFAEAVAISGEKISLVGEYTEVERATGVETRVIDCAGKTVVPGFNDAHLHLFSLM